MKNLKTAIIAALVVIAFSSCHHSSSTTNCINTFGYLANGHRLHYTITTNFFFSDTGQDVTFASSPTSDVYMVTSVSDQGSLNYTEYYHPCNDNLYIGATIAASQTSTQVDQKVNPALNTTWTETQGTTTSVYTVIGKNVSVTVPAGTFSCDEITYHQTGTFNTDTIFTNSAVGYVKYNGIELAYQLLYKNF